CKTICCRVVRLRVSCCTCSGSREGEAGAFGATFSGAVCATGAACGVAHADGRTAGFSGPAGGVLPPSLWAPPASSFLGSRRPAKCGGPCRDYLLGCLAVGLPSQGACNTDTNSEQEAGEPM